MRFQLLLWCELRCALAHTCSVVPESSLTPRCGVTRVLLCEIKLLIARAYYVCLQLGKVHAKLVYTSPSLSGGIISVDFLTCAFPALFTSNPHASKYRWRPAG